MLHEMARFGTQVSPVVGIAEMAGRDPGARGNRLQVSDPVIRQRAVDGKEFVVLLFAHDTRVLRCRVVRLRFRQQDNPACPGCKRAASLD